MTMTQRCASTHRKDGTQVSEGYATPACLDTEQCHSFCPERVIPVIFIPGILGSNLRIHDKERLALLSRKYKRDKGNTAWCPDRLSVTFPFGSMSTAERQLILDPATTEVDTFDFNANTPNNERMWDYQDRTGVAVDTNSPHLRSDGYYAGLPAYPRSKSARRKACERGWGEVMFSSYGAMLNRAERMLNRMFEQEGKKTKLNPDWKGIVGADPQEFGSVEKLPPLTEGDLLKAAENCWFPVHAAGVNWLLSVGDSCMAVRERIESIMAGYRGKKMRCEKVIIVTHSHGGLVARALCHPKYGNFEDKVLGVVHGEQPAVGAAAAYYRMLGGWEAPPGFAPLDSIAGWALGDEGPEVTAMLGNSPGGMQLLPFREYGAGWLEVVDNKGRVLRSLPEKDPYEEIYTKSGREAWWGLLREEWLNPAELEEDAGLIATRKMIKDEVRPVHEALGNYYHPVSYAHYGDDPDRKSLVKARWRLAEEPAAAYREKTSLADFVQNKPVSAGEVDALPIDRDRGDKKIRLKDTTHNAGPPRGGLLNRLSGPDYYLQADLLPPAGPGDQTVPTHSAEHQRNGASPKFRGVFALRGFEHQGSYKEQSAQDATLYGIVQIAKEMKW